MYIEELEEGVPDSAERSCCKEIVVSDTKRALVGAGARLLFYPTLLYNVLRNMIQSEFRWWDAVDQFLLLGAVPFPTDVPRLKQLGVCGVVTLNESYETLVPTSLYHAHGIEHLVLPTRDYLFAPSFRDICEAVDFINKNTSNGKKTYVHCKAGRGRSTTIVLCYLVQYKQMTPKVAYEYVRSIRSRVLLAPAQWKAVQHFYSLRVKSTWNAIRSSVERPKQLDEPHDCEDANDRLAMVPTSLNPSYFTMKNSGFSMKGELAAFDENSVVVITESDLVGYNDCDDNTTLGNEVCSAEVSIVYKVQFASQAALARLAGFRLRCTVPEKISGEKLGSKSSCGAGADKMGGVGVDIHVY